jgi:hypothetical protein
MRRHGVRRVIVRCRATAEDREMTATALVSAGPVHPHCHGDWLARRCFDARRAGGLVYSDPATAASVTYAKHAQRPWCRLSLDVRSSVRGRLAIDMVLRADVALSMLPQPARHVVPSGRATCTVRSRGTR